MHILCLSSVTKRPLLSSSVAILAFVLGSSNVQAAELVLNGGFESLLEPGVSAQIGDKHPSQQAVGWDTSGYTFVFTPNTADSTGAVGQYGSLSLWGPNNGSANGLTSTSPAGGNFLAMDGAFEVEPLTQIIPGFTPGHAVTLSFYWAGAQQAGFNSPTTEQFSVSLGSETQYTNVLENENHGFTGWQHASMTFHPTKPTEILSFLAIGTPSGVPPFSLLDGVSIQSSTPEPATLGTLMMSFLATVGAAFYKRRRL